MNASPFDVLGIPATLDLQTIKRAYFSAIAKTPPHADPPKFRQIRDSYESLLSEEKRVLAFLRQPIRADEEVAAFDAKWAERIRVAQTQARPIAEAPEAVRRFIERLSRLEWTDVRVPTAGCSLAKR